MASALKPLSFLAILLLAVAPAWASVDDDPFWEEEEYEDDFMNGTGTGGGPSMTWYLQDLDAVNGVLENAEFDLLGIPQKELYWGGAGWVGIATGGDVYMAIGGGGYGGGQEAAERNRYSKWSSGAGYFAMKGIYPLHRHIFIEAGVHLGAGSSSFLVEESIDPGPIEVHLRGERQFLLLRPQLGVDIRLARWAGLLIEGGYAITSGSWTLEGAPNLIEVVHDKLPEGDEPYVSVTVRFGI